MPVGRLGIWNRLEVIWDYLDASVRPLGGSVWEASGRTRLPQGCLAGGRRGLRLKKMSQLLATVII